MTASTPQHPTGYNLLRNPRLAHERLAGMYVLMHAIQDSFSAAHAARDDQGRIIHLLSWKLIDWPRYFAHGRGTFSTVNGVKMPMETGERARSPCGRRRSRRMRR
jgi:hypothetical protein